MYTAPASLVKARFIGLSFKGAASCSEKRQQVMISGSPPFSCKTCKIQIVVSHDEFNIYIRQLGLDIRRIGFVQVIRPQIHLNGLSILLLFHIFGGFVPQPVSTDRPITNAANAERRRRNVLLFIKSFPSTTLGQLPFCTPEYHKRHRYSMTEL